MRPICLLFLRWYQLWLSSVTRFFGAQCRYDPSCSAYAIRSFQSLPWHRAMWATIRRVSSCHPWCKGE